MEILLKEKYFFVCDYCLPDTFRKDAVSYRPPKEKKNLSISIFYFTKTNQLSSDHYFFFIHETNELNFLTLALKIELTFLAAAFHVVTGPQ